MKIPYHIPGPVLTTSILIVIAGSCQRALPEPKGAISTASPEASKAGIQVLRYGGNAMDAAIAISLVLGVSEPAMSGLGGGTQILLSVPNAEPVMINGSTLAPIYLPDSITRTDLTFHRRSTVPSVIKTLHFAWKTYGSGRITWNELVDPAIKYARQGFVVGPFRHLVYRRHEKALTESPYHAHQYLLNGKIPEAGDTLMFDRLARTLEVVASDPESFYRGEIAEQIAIDMESNGGWIGIEDLNRLNEPSVLPALHSTYRGFDVYTSTPPCGGWVMLLALNLLEQSSPKDLAPGTESRLNRMLQALHIAHNDRLNRPITDFQNYQSQLREKLSKKYAQDLLGSYAVTLGAGSSKDLDATGGETTHFSVVDANGMAVAVTASINAYFGAKAASQELGFLYNSYMDDFNYTDSDDPYFVGSGKMAYSSMTPTIVRKDGKTILVLGSPGSARIISAVTQVIQYWADGEQSIEKAVVAPRYHAIGARVYVEDPRDSLRIDARLLPFEVRLYGTDLAYGSLNPSFGGVHAIALEKGRWVGVADPRRDGTVEYQ